MSFSKIFPGIEMEPVSSDIESAAPACFPETFDPLKRNMKVSAVEYRMPDKRLIRSLVGRSAGPVLYNGNEIIEVRWREIQGNKPVRKITHWINPMNADGDMELVLREALAEEDVLRFDDVSLTCPRIMQIPSAFTMQDKYRHVHRVAVDAVEHHVDGFFSVSIANKIHTCYRLITHRTVEPKFFAETFIDISSGFVVCRKHYQGTVPEISPGIKLESTHSEYRYISVWLVFFSSEE